MRLSLRFIIPLTIVLAFIAFTTVSVVDRLTFKWFIRDIEMHNELLANTVGKVITPLINGRQKEKIQQLFNDVIQEGRLHALGYCDLSLRMLYQTETMGREIQCKNFPDEGSLLELPEGPLYVAYFPLVDSNTLLGHLVLVNDFNFIQRRSSDTKKYIAYFFMTLGIVISLITVLIAQLSWKAWMNSMRSLIKKGDSLKSAPLPPVASPPEFRPILKDLRTLVRELESERKVRDEGQMSWNPRTLKEILQRELAGDEILIVSNRQPYIHVKKEDSIEVQVPASGLVTALEPIMRACSGTWVAFGNGSADHLVVDKHDRVRVPPGDLSYQIRRVWLSPEEEQGYYYGFANEGLWPLCHVAHVRPIFRSSDWNYYYSVNKKFAKAVVEEAKTIDPVILIQDYHFGLLPRFLREELPQATIITFWHIPWPNFEAFAICPWKEEILEGLLGSSILGFHTRFHCNNFIDTVDRFLECRIDKETSTIGHGGKYTAINSYPISIEWPPQWAKDQKTISECRKIIKSTNRIGLNCKIGLGVDRLDYTKGILERFYSIERLLELEPYWIGRFTFIQIGSPTRTSIPQYQNFENEVRETANNINKKFAREGYRPICLRLEHHHPSLVFDYYRGSDLCFVSSLHDGMNLVAKEFVSARDDELGVLILSQFTGASRDLPESLVVNPYNIDQCAAALHLALEMPESEQKKRMRIMRGYIQEFNVFRWAGKMLIDAARIRQRNRFLNKVHDVSVGQIIH